MENKSRLQIKRVYEIKTKHSYWAAWTEQRTNLEKAAKNKKNGLCFGWGERHSPIQLQGLGSALTLQQTPPLPHGHLTGVLGGVQIDRCVVHRRLGRDKDRRGGGGWVGDRRWQGRRRRRRAGVGGGGSERRGRGWDEWRKRGLGGRRFTFRPVAPIRPGGLVVGEGGGSRGVRVVLRRWMCEGHRFDDVWPVVLVTREENMQIPTTEQRHSTCFTHACYLEPPHGKLTDTD